QEMVERIGQLEKQLRSDRKPPHSCKLSGKLEGAFVSLRAEFAFSTEQPHTTVVLGLKGAHLLDEGTLDNQTAIPEVGDEGFAVRVEKEGNHALALNLRVPVESKKTGAGDRGFDLELPGSAVTTLTLDLPPAVKEVRWSDKVQRQQQGARWVITDLDK